MKRGHSEKSLTSDDDKGWQIGVGRSSTVETSEQSCWLPIIVLDRNRTYISWKMLERESSVSLYHVLRYTNNYIHWRRQKIEQKKEEEL